MMSFCRKLFSAGKTGKRYGVGEKRLVKCSRLPITVEPCMLIQTPEITTEDTSIFRTVTVVPNAAFAC